LAFRLILAIIAIKLAIVIAAELITIETIWEPHHLAFAKHNKGSSTGLHTVGGCCIVPITVVQVGTLDNKDATRESEAATFCWYCFWLGISIGDKTQKIDVIFTYRR
jgi:hypothetical protein